MLSSNKSFTFQAKHSSDNEETTLKQHHHEDFTLKQEVLEIIKRLHEKCGFLDTDNLFMLPINWLNNCEVFDINVEILENVYNAYYTPKYFFVEKDFDSWDPKIHGPHTYLQIFMWTLSLMNTGP